MGDPIEKLPDVNSCCFFVPLKWGTIIVIILSILLCGGPFVPGLIPGSSVGCIMGQSTVGKVLSYFSYVLYIASVVILIASIAFLIGIFLDKSITAKIYIYSGLFFLLVYIIFAILSLVAQIMPMVEYGAKFCPFPVAELIIYLITIACWLYFVIIAKSYMTQEMGD